MKAGLGGADTLESKALARMWFMPADIVWRACKVSSHTLPPAAATPLSIQAPQSIPTHGQFGVDSFLHAEWLQVTVMLQFLPKNCLLWRVGQNRPHAVGTQSG